MNCCGGARRGTMQPAADRAPAQPPAIEFEYTGASALTVIGGDTRHCYRFEHPGACLLVRARDAPGLMAIASLRRTG